jgi:hypothetical protein
MNIMIAAVGVDPGFATGGGSAEEAIIGFAIVGLILLFAAGRMCRQAHAHRHAHHVSHYVSRF